MITAIDTNVLLDVLSGEKLFGPTSLDAIVRCALEGPILACDAVWAETRAWHRTDEEMSTAMDHLGVAYATSSPASAHQAGRAWRRYRQEGGPRTRLVSDFLIGGHAIVHANRLLTRDRGFFRRYFTGLAVLDPTSG